MLDHCVARFALSWNDNDNVSSAYRIAFAGERERDRKQRDFAPKNAIENGLVMTSQCPLSGSYCRS